MGGNAAPKKKQKGKKKKEGKKMQLQREDKVFSSGVHSWGVFLFVISLIKADLGVAEPGRRGAEGGIAAGTGTWEEKMQSARRALTSPRQQTCAGRSCSKDKSVRSAKESSCCWKAKSCSNTLECF